MIIFARSTVSDAGYFSTGNERNPIVLPAYSRQAPRKQIIQDIYDTWNENAGNIDCLFMYAHGNAGVLWLGDPGFGKYGAGLMTPLYGCFSAGGRGIELHGCACASATDVSNWNGRGTPSSSGKGYEFLHAMAKATGTTVTASVDSVSGWSAAYSFDGVRTMTVWPSGSCAFGGYGN